MLTVGDIAFGRQSTDPKLSLAARRCGRVDNDRFLASQTLHRHQVPGPDYPVWNQFRNADGTPQVPAAADAARTKVHGGGVGHGALRPLRREDDCRCVAAGSRGVPVAGRLVPARGQPSTTEPKSTTASASGSPTTRCTAISSARRTRRARSATSACCTRPTRPERLGRERRRSPASTSYEVLDGQVVVLDNAADRQGVQPVVTLTADGSPRADVSAGAEVTLRAVAEAPRGTGVIVSVAWDVDGAGRFPVVESVEPGGARRHRAPTRLHRRHLVPHGPGHRHPRRRRGHPVRPNPEPGPRPRRRRPVSTPRLT